MKSVLLGVLLLLSSQGLWAATLAENLFREARQSDANESATAFFILANIQWTPDLLSDIRDGYQAETREIRRLFYEFALAKRTQEPRYLTAFLQNAKGQLTFLADNQTQWVAIENPYYSYVASKARFDDEALGILIALSEKTDGAMLASVVDDLRDLRNRDADRFERVAREASAGISTLTPD